MQLVENYRRTAAAPLRPLMRGMDALVHGQIGRWQRRRSLATQLRLASERLWEEGAALWEQDDKALQRTMLEHQSRFRRGEELPRAAVLQALGAVAEAARRTLGLRPHPVQLMAALASWEGFGMEMSTGEGKTLTVALAAVLAGWRGEPCHILTSNDYLAQRDSASLSPFYQHCGLTAGAVLGEMTPCDRREGYRQSITYTTSKEAVADFLRDRLELRGVVDPTRRLLAAMLAPGGRGRDAGLVQRGLHTAIVDEADSALVDEAVTPLIISRAQEQASLRDACIAAHRLAGSLAANADYVADERTQEIRLLAPGLAKLASGAGELPPMWRGAQRRAELATQALRAARFFHRDKQYVVEDGKVVIVDEYTGRLMPQRSWREGLHQAVEAQEGLKVSSPAETLARLSFQRFFRLYRRLSGMSGTVLEAAPELWHLFRLPVIRIPTHRPCRRLEMADRLHGTAEQKWAAIRVEIAARHARRQPVLVGTRSVHASELLAASLEAAGLPCSLLNATRHREEAAIIAQAGEQGRITIATNMAGRGTDIVLGPLVAETGGLHVILTERHDSRRIDRQLAGRAARQGDPGSVQAFTSLEDDLAVRHISPWLLARARDGVLAGLPGAIPAAQALLERAQRTAERGSCRQRRQVLETDTWIDESLAWAGQDHAG